ncbi:uncharacterized protein BHQ10_000222 [Talaromyces amestolkiae]|uniref:Cytochrome P450 n=1 Tax=Talaromyces amestolkiae TaxID=1196081 RepID=A0A364KKY5_TALAM|nr:uncharacterized protein BHQ10_000222 [Talaromyces amestolkiae]RAO64210.1 hypothetical protein BHQ10_000222 [Talaromyces amestolkiae]
MFDHDAPAPLAGVVATVIVFAAVGSAALAIYRLCFSPLALARVPGPKIAAITAWYEFYWDCVQQGRYLFKIEQMHQKYGPIVRINPWEVHIQDPSYWDTIYTNNKIDKDAWFYRAFGDNRGTVGTGPWDLHRRRRAAMAKFFSAANVARLEPKVLARVQKLLDRVEEFRQTGGGQAAVLPISHAFRCYATDVISDYAAPHTRDFLSTPDFSATFNQVLRDFSEIMLWHRHFPIVFPIFGAIPRWLISMMDSTGAQIAVLDNQASLLKQAQTVIATKGVPPEKSSPTVLDAIYTSDVIGPEEKTLPRMMAETQAILGAGTETTGNTLSNFVYNVLSNKSIVQKLTTELGEASSASALLDYKTLERLPYLQACIKEALRLGMGVVGRLPRINQTESMTYTTKISNGESSRTYTFPPGTVLSMSIIDMHLNDDIFPKPRLFKPERWLDSSPTHLRQMEKSFVPFGKGVRGCLGIELAKEELTLMAGNLFRRYGRNLELYETSERDISIVHDYFAPFGPKDSKGVRVVVR